MPIRKAPIFRHGEWGCKHAFHASSNPLESDMQLTTEQLTLNLVRISAPGSRARVTRRSALSTAWPGSPSTVSCEMSCSRAGNRSWWTPTTMSSCSRCRVRLHWSCQSNDDRGATARSTYLRSIPAACAAAWTCGGQAMLPGSLPLAMPISVGTPSSRVECLQFAAHDLACRCLWQIGNELNGARHLVGCQLITAQRQDRLGISAWRRASRRHRPWRSHP